MLHFRLHRFDVAHNLHEFPGDLVGFKVSFLDSSLNRRKFNGNVFKLFYQILQLVVEMFLATLDLVHGECKFTLEFLQLTLSIIGGLETFDRKYLKKIMEMDKNLRIKTEWETQATLEQRQSQVRVDEDD